MITHNLNNKLNDFILINEVVNYNPPKYFPNWDGSFNKIKSGKSFYYRPNKIFSNFYVDINKGNSLRLNETSTGIYIILSEKLNFFYVGKTLNNIKQRLYSHIQKITSTNNNRGTTPLKWQQLSYNRYKVLKEDSVKLDDIKIKFYHSSEYSLYNIDELEKDIFFKYKDLLPKYISLNDPKTLESKN